ncbi:MAG: hypothetical protein ACTSQA_01475 [Candidatus Heimdallarchaeaceae archaeon]
MNEKHEVIAVGMDLVKLIEQISTNFEEEYGFKPTKIKVTNLIAKRSWENNLFK